MNKMKKALSFVLCLAMLVSTFAIGFSFTASAEETSGVKSYADLCDRYHQNGVTDNSFVYLATEVYTVNDNNGQIDKLVTGDTLEPGKTYAVKFYMKSDYTNSGGSTNGVFKYDQFLIMTQGLSPYFSGTGSIKSVRSGAGNLSCEFSDDDSQSAVVDKWIEDDGNDGWEYTSEGSVFDGLYTPSEIFRWNYVEIKYTKSAIVPMNSDEPLATFTFKTKSDDYYIGREVSLFIPTKSYSCETGSSDISYVGLGEKDNNVEAANFDYEDACHTYTLSANFNTNFIINGTTYTMGAPLNEPVPFPANDDVYGYVRVDNNDNILNNGRIYCKDEIILTNKNQANQTYRAVMKTDPIPVTLQLGEYGTYNDQKGDISITVPAATGFNAASYVAEPEADVEFKGWTVLDSNGGGTDTNLGLDGLFKFKNINGYNIRVNWNGEVVIRFARPDGTWFDLGEYMGAYGSSFTKKDIANMCNMVANAVNDGTVKNETGVDYKYQVGTNYVDELSNRFDENTVIGTLLFYDGLDDEGNKFYSQIGVKNSLSENYCENFTFGELTVVYVASYVIASANVYIPKFDDNKNIVKDNDGNTEWELVDSIARTYKSVSNGDVPYSDVDGSTYEDWSSNYSKAALEEYSKSIDKYRYTKKYFDGNGTELKVSRLGDVLVDGSNRTEGTTNADLYIAAVDRVYNIWIKSEVDAANMKYAATTTSLKFGDTVDASAFKNYNRVYNITNIEKEFTLEDLKDDGAVMNEKGYKLDYIYYNGEDGEIKLSEDGTVVIDEALVDALYRENTTNNISGLMFPIKWISKDYNYTLYYMNASGEWTVLLEKVFYGSEVVNYTKFVGTGSEYEKKIEEDVPVNKVATKGMLASNKEGKLISNIKAYDGPFELYIVYSASRRYAYVRFNDAVTGADAIPDVHYRQMAFEYGTELYDPEYKDPEEGEEAVKAKPWFNQLLDTFRPTSYPTQTEKTDSDGNVIYEPIYEPQYEVDGEGDPVLDENGNKVPVKDENGNIIYTNEAAKDPETGEILYSDVAVMTDPKGSFVNRPYRNCEYMGYTVYYLPDIYTSYADLPDESEWIEGYNDQGDYNLYTTTILRIDWKDDDEFIYRVYDDNSNIYCARDKQFKKYYWANNVPCSKEEAVLNHNPDNQAIILIIPHIETITPQMLPKLAENDPSRITQAYNNVAGRVGLDTQPEISVKSLYFTSFALSFTPWLYIKNVTDYIPVIGDLLKGLLA